MVEIEKEAALSGANRDSRLSAEQQLLEGGSEEPLRESMSRLAKPCKLICFWFLTECLPNREQPEQG